MSLHTDAMLVLADREIKLVSANGSYKDFFVVRYGKCHVKAVGNTKTTYISPLENLNGYAFLDIAYVQNRLKS